MKKSDVFKLLSEKTGLKKVQLDVLFKAIESVAAHAMKEDGLFHFPGVVRIFKKVQKAVPEREGLNPFTKEKQTFKARPERTKVKSTVSRALREIVEGAKEKKPKKPAAKKPAMKTAKKPKTAEAKS